LHRWKNRALSFEDFESLCDDDVLKPHARNLTVKPHIRLWSVPSPLERSRASGHVEIEGFLPNSALRTLQPPREEQKAICDFLDAKLAESKLIVAGIETQIAALTAYRKSLIHECVTGQRRITEAGGPPKRGD